ncbi:MAG: DUF4956 domain-containing protein [Lentisphaerales bacterium]|jgi:uncharacterized membrane protein YhiD involved in acid resistance|nr:MAG: DUF4956 domain-containing protein [Lentisphaerales bacterium]
MDEFIQAFGSAKLLGPSQMLVALLLSFILCSVIATVYRWTYQGFSYSRSFVHTIILGGIITTVLIMAIGNNLARGLGILGTLALIRFRTPIRDPRDIIFLFASLAIGIASGAAVITVAVTGTLFFCGVALYLHYSPFASRREYEGLLRFMLPPQADDEDEVKRVMHECCESYQLVAMREAAQGDLLEYSYHVRLIDPSYQSNLVDGLHAIPSVSDANLLMHRSTVEL